MSYKEIILAIRGYERKQIRDWERSRLISYQVYSSVARKGQNISIQSYLPLPSDRLKNGKVSRDEMRAMKDAFLNRKKHEVN